MTMNSNMSNISKELQDCVTFFLHSNDEAAMATVTNPAVKQALMHLKELSADPEFRRIVAERERVLSNDRSQLQDTLCDTLSPLLTKRFGVLTEATSQCLQTATAEQLKLWTDRILDAPTLAEVFA